MTDHETAHNNNVDDHDNVEEVSPAYDKAENKTTSKQDREQWEKNVKDRLEKASGQLQHDEKRSMQLGGAALVLAAVGGALLVRAVADPGRVIEFGRTTLLAASIFFSIVILSAEVVARWRRQSFEARVEPAVPLLGVLTLGFAIVLLSEGLVGGWTSLQVPRGALGVTCLAGTLGLIAIALYYNAKARRDEQRIADLQFEADLLRYDVEPFESRAEKLLGVNQIQLRRYYELNLQQARAVFVVGITCIAAGLGVIALTFWLVYWLGKNAPPEEKFSQIVIAIVGTAGTVLTNYVAAMYFKMHADISHSLIRFHQQLAATNDLFFANVLASSIRDNAQRWRTVMQMAIAIAGAKLENTERIEATLEADKAR